MAMRKPVRDCLIFDFRCNQTVMKRLFTIISGVLLMFLACYPAVAQIGNTIVLDQNSFKAVFNEKDPLAGITIDPIQKDRSNRPCVRIKIHVSRMTADDITLLEVKAIGGNVVVMKREVAYGKNGIIVEMTANPNLRFYLHHPRFGDSNSVTVNAEGDEEYLMEAYLQGLQSVMFSSNVPGAKVWLDDEYQGQLDASGSLPVTGIPVGPHKLKMTYDGGQEQTRDIEVSDLNFYFRIDLFEVKKCNILSEPSGAEIYLDGKHIGKTPFYAYPLTATTHEIEAVREGIRDMKTIDISGVSSDITFDVQSYVPVKITVNDAKEGAELQIDGGDWQKAPFNGKLNVGNHDFVVRGYDGHMKSYSQQVVKGAENAFSYEWPGAGAYRSDRFWWGVGDWLFMHPGVVFTMPVMTFNKGYESGYGGIIAVNLCWDVDEFWDWEMQFAPYVKYTSTFNAGKFKTYVQPIELDSFTWNHASGVKALNTTSITAGVMWGIGPVMPYIGLGYGRRTHYKIHGNDLYTSSDMKYENCDMDFGLVLGLGRFKLMAGMTFPGANVWYPIYNIANYSWDYLRWAAQGAWRFTCWFYSLGPIFNLIDLAAGEDMTGYSDVLDTVAPMAPNPIERSKHKTWKWFPYNFVELNIGIGFAF